MEKYKTYLQGHCNMKVTVTSKSIKHQVEFKYLLKGKVCLTKSIPRSSARGEISSIVVEKIQDIKAVYVYCKVITAFVLHLFCAMVKTGFCFVFKIKRLFRNYR